MGMESNVKNKDVQLQINTYAWYMTRVLRGVWTIILAATKYYTHGSWSKKGGNYFGIHSMTELSFTNIRQTDNCKL